MSALSDTKENQEAGQVAVEATAGIRTVTAFGLQPQLLALFEAALDKELAKAQARARAAGLGTGASNFVIFACYAVIFYVGGRFIHDKLVSQQHMLEVFFAITMAAQGVSQAFAFQARGRGGEIVGGEVGLDLVPLPPPSQIDRGKAEKATRSIFAIIDRVSSIDPAVPVTPAGQLLGGAGADASRMVCSGSIELRNVHFRYPTRPTQPVLRGVSIRIEAGQVVALVGPSGSGKSSIVALVERFYDPLEGAVLVDGVDIRTLHPHAVRNNMALVQQEPALW